MATNNEEPPFRLRPRRSKGNPNDDPRRYVGALRSVLRLVQMMKRRRKAHARSQCHPRQSSAARLYSQRVSVRVTYTKNKNPGQWKAHGHYIARESATREGHASQAGFDANRTDLNIASILDTWQKAGDERVFKIIVSPEFGERLDLQDQTRQLLSRMGKDLGTHLEWVAAAHFNTEHPHVHIALRGRDQTGSPLRLSRDYIRSGIRFHAENLATEALGFRTERDAEEAQRREITQSRFTTLDRIIQRSNGAQSPSFVIATDNTSARLSERERILQQNLTARLAHLEKMGLARSIGPQQWTVRSDFETILRTLQRSNDHQKMLAAQGAFLSDPRLPFEITDVRRLEIVEGRVLLHAEDEYSGRRYLLLEGTDAKLHLIYHTETIEKARHSGKLGINCFVRFEKRYIKNIASVHASDIGDAHVLLTDKDFLRQQARALLRQGIRELETWSGGWLGKYQTAIGTQLRHEASLRHTSSALTPQR